MNHERFRVELYGDRDGQAKELAAKVPFEAFHATPHQLTLTVDGEDIILPKLFTTQEEAEKFCESIPLPDDTCFFITQGEFGPGVTPEELDEMSLEEALEMCEWDAYAVVRIYVKEI